MARTNPNTSNLPQNPSKMFAQWKDPGLFLYWDKSLEKNVELPSNFTFIVLDELSTIKGWNDPTQSAIYSNEIRNIKSEILTVKAFKGGLIAEGTYGNIHDTIVAAGGKYCASVYIAYKDAEGFKIGNIQFTGSSLGGWFEFRKEVLKSDKNALYNKAVQLVGKTEAKKGATKYYVPVFKLIDVSPATDEAAEKLQAELMEYHKEYFSKAIPADLEKELDNVKSEVEQQKEIMDKHFADGQMVIPDDAYVTKKEIDNSASFQPDSEAIGNLPF